MRAWKFWGLFLVVAVGWCAGRVNAVESLSLPLSDPVESLSLPLSDPIEKETIVLRQRGDAADVYFPALPAWLRAFLKDLFPVVAVLQGAGVDKGQYEEFGKQLARYGFVVVIPNHFQVFGPPGTPPTQFPDQHVVLDVLAQMKLEDTNPNSPLYRIVDTEHLGVVGHSVGGVVGLFVIEGSCKPPFCFGFFQRPAALWAGAFYGTNTCFPTGTLTDLRCQSIPSNPAGHLIDIATGNLPVALVQGSRDSLSTPAEGEATFDILDGPRKFSRIDGANHYGICDENNPLGPIPDPNAPTIAQAQSVQAIVRAIGPFLRLRLFFSFFQ